MSLIEEYYELFEAESVSPIWKTLQILFYVFAGGLGLWGGFTIAILRQEFQDRCYLFTRAVGSPIKNFTTLTDMSWEDDIWCDYYQFTLVGSFVACIIWAAFFLMCGKGGKSNTGLPQPWRIVLPSLIFNFSYFLVILSNSVSIHKGTTYFCNIPNAYRINDTKCPSLIGIVKGEYYDVMTFQIAVVPRVSWCCAIAWFILAMLSLFRIVFIVDFRLYKICVFRVDDKQNRKEEVLKITNYDEPKRLFSKTLESAIALLEDPEGTSDRQKRRIRSTKLKRSSSQTQQDSAFYQMNENIRSKNKKGKNDLTTLKEALETNLGAEVIPSGFEAQPFLQHPEKIHETDEDVTATFAKMYFNDNSESESETSLLAAEQKKYLAFKKLL